ncbi:MAG TPA: energy transducer TonB [Polyangia bacterium]|nr:energy transducer TonB [Polyangia bacterium]
MKTRTQTLVWAGVVVASLGLHAVAFGGLGRGGWGTDTIVKRRKPATVDISVNPPKPAPKPEAPKAVEPKAKLAMARPAQKIAAPPPPSAAPPPAAESPADFTGQTLTNEGPGEGWASATGNGQKMNGPVGRPGAHVTHRVVDGDEGDAHGPRTVGLGDLSKPPTAPDLAGALEAAYPADARAKGVAGKAVVRARVMPDGQLRELALVSESASGFGRACERTLRGSSWTPPLDKGGQPVSTFINYTCRFNVE